MKSQNDRDWLASATKACLAICFLGLAVNLQAADEEPTYPPHEKIVAGFTKAESHSPDHQTLGNIWTRDRDAQMFLEIPKDFATKKYFIALTISSGDEYAGLQAGDYYVYWRMYNKRLALILPNVDVRSSGEPESKSSVKRLFTDKVLLDIPIVTMVPRGGPMIDADALFIGEASKFFGPQARITSPMLSKIVKAKSFSKNVEIAFEVVGRNGQLQTLHYSMSEVPDDNGYKPRKSDERIGYFSTAFSDLGIYDEDKVKNRYINRWRLEKRDPNLKISPPVTPIRFYVEHTTPVRYRRWVKQGIEYWNKAFEKVGFADAIEVYYQDARTGAFMDLDPEDVQYNFIRWLNNNEGTAIGPSRVNPLTGEILDADIILTDGWIRHFHFQFSDLMPEIATEGMSGETLSWLADYPTWDPRVRFSNPSNQRFKANAIARDAQKAWNADPATTVDSHLIGDDAMDGLVGRTSQINGMCMAAHGKQMDIAMARIALTMLDIEEDEIEKKKDREKKKEEEDAKAIASETKPSETKPSETQGEAAKSGEAKKGDKTDEDKVAKKDEEKKGDEKKEGDKKKDDKPKEEMLDGMPETFIGPLLAELVAHEVGHTLGLRHNFKASGAYSLEEINSPELRGKKPLAGSVMDYLPVNMSYQIGDARGDWTMIGIGPYDYWAIEYGYVPEEAKLKDILKRVGEPELQYATDEDTRGPDPLARPYDYGRDPLVYAENQMKLVKLYRERLIDKFVKDGESWGKAREGYELTLAQQMRSISMIANWVGAAHVNRDHKGDPGNRMPITPVAADVQRKSLEFVIANAFQDQAYGLTPSILKRLTVEKWWDEGMRAMSESTFPVHDRILSVQASALTMLMNPSTLRRVLDNEQMVPAGEDAVVLPELMDRLQAAIWSELDAKPDGEVSPRKPRISSLRRNLQHEHIDRLIDLAFSNRGIAAMKPISTLAVMQLKDIKRKIDSELEARGGLDAYSEAHLSEAQSRIAKALDGQFIYNMPKSFGGSQVIQLMLGEETPPRSNYQIVDPTTPPDNP
ncbi:MAG: zinc-dependent metalloprotease [Pirellulaceae bacterium]|nr:zinc-dependent metalloprotease [Pirellulaceae bacterium]